jgi:hypothetical protein
MLIQAPARPGLQEIVILGPGVQDADSDSVLSDRGRCPLGGCDR